MSDEVQRASARARTVLEDEIFQETVLDIEKNLIEQWRSAKSVEAREQAHAELLALGRVLHKLRTVMDRAAYERARVEKDKPQ